MDIGYYLFEFKNKYYLHDYAGGVILELSEKFYAILKKYRFGRLDNCQEQKIIDKLHACGVLCDLNKIPDKDPAEKKIAYLSFAPTYKCNFRCSYCFGKHGDSYTGKQREFTRESLFCMLDFFFTVAYPAAEQYRIDFVSGGEPLLGFDIIKMAIKYLEKYVSESGKKVSVWLCTNGSLLTNRIVEYLSFHNISIGISIDGVKEKNDQARVDAYGNGTYDQICKGILLIKENSKISKKTKNIWGLCTATNENCDFVEMLKHMTNLGFQNVQIRLIRSEKKYNLKKLISQYDRLVDFLITEFLQGNLNYFRMILNDNDQFGKILKRIMLNQILIRRCNAGINKITICPDGTIYPCDSLVGISDSMIGNIKDINLANNVYKSRNINHIEKCQKCDVKYLCGGDCYYNSFMKTGNQFIPDPEFCIIQKYLINSAIVLRYEMQIENKELYSILLKEVKMKNDYNEFFG